MIKDSKYGVLLKCDNSGVIQSILFNNIFDERVKLEDQLFPDLFQSEEIKRAIQFLIDIKKHSASFGCVLTPKDSLNSCYFSGAIWDGAITICGALTDVSFEKFLSELMSINNEQTNTIRALQKSKMQDTEPLTNANSKLFDQISRLNNELVDMQREIAKKNSELLALNKIKNQFLGMAAHDLRNPLGFILNYCELLEEEKEKLSKDQVEFLNEIKSLDNYMLSIVTDLLDVSSIESGKVNLNQENADIVSILRNIVEFNRFISEKKQIEIILKEEIGSAVLTIDKVKIEQVITNLISNAIKYSFPNSTITVELSKTESNITVSVIDQGQGIEKREQDLLFLPFQKTSAKTTGGEKSTGLGLYIVKRIIESHNGKIWVESSPGVGSTFYFSLPI